jgi:hypothetical protein
MFIFAGFWQDGIGVVLFLRESALFFPDKTVSDEQNDGSGGGDEDAAEVKGLDLAESDETAEEATDHRTNDADDDSNNESARVFAGHDEFRKCAGDEAKQDPG